MSFFSRGSGGIGNKGRGRRPNNFGETKDFASQSILMFNLRSLINSYKLVS